MWVLPLYQRVAVSIGRPAAAADAPLAIVRTIVIASASKIRIAAKALMGEVLRRRSSPPPPPSYSPSPPSLPPPLSPPSPPPPSPPPVI